MELIELGRMIQNNGIHKLKSFKLIAITQIKVLTVIMISIHGRIVLRHTFS